MASNINVAIPPLGSPTTAGVRGNFATAKTEIEAMQLARVLRLAYRNEGIEGFQQCVTTDVAQVVTFNTEIFNHPAGSFTWDSLNSEIIINEPGWYSWQVNLHVTRKVATSNVNWSIWSQVKEPPAAVFSNYVGAGRSMTLIPDATNNKHFLSFGFDVHTPVAGTRIRFMQATSDASKQVGIISYPATGIYPSMAGIMMSIHRLSVDE